MRKILIIDDEGGILETLDMFLRERGFDVFKAASGEEGIGVYRAHRPDVVILDIRLPDQSGLEVLKKIKECKADAKVIMITAYHDMDITIQAMKVGAFDYIHKPLDIDEVLNGIKRALKTQEADRVTSVPEDTETPPNPWVIIGKSKGMLEVFKTIGLLSQNRSIVLIQGETGTGKELIARAIHNNSFFSHEPFIVVDCSAMVKTLLESELFGHEKGAYTGATTSKKGQIELAGNGTLFLDEIGELDISLQGKFLGLLQRRAYSRVGGQHPIESNCRIIAAANRDLGDLVRKGLFKEDLYFRLKVVTINVPPLAARLCDLPDLVRHFLRKINHELGTDVQAIEDGAMAVLMAREWRGNVRELENLLISAVVRTRGKVILADDLKEGMANSELIAFKGLSSFSMDEVEKKHIQNVLVHTQGFRKETADLLGISLPTLRSKIHKYGIKIP